MYKIYHKICSIGSSEILCDDFLCHVFAFRDKFNARIGSPLLFCTFFHIKIIIFLESVAFARIATSTEQELYFRIVAISPRYPL